MRQNIIEPIVGLAVLLIAGWFLIFAYKTGNSYKSMETYRLKASFQNAEGIVAGSDVMISGIKVGEVKELFLDKTTFFAIAEFELYKGMELPDDTHASIVTSGFIGSKFISLFPGASETNFKSGDTIKYTQSSINIESIIGKLMYGK